MTRDMRFHWWTSGALLVLGGLMAMAFHAPQQSLQMLPRRPEDRNVLRVAYTQEMVPDPHKRIFPLAQHNQLILSLWEPLVECDPTTGEPQPAAARSWEWSPDKLSLTLDLAPGARWSNGDPLTAHDFVRGWLLLLRQGGMAAELLFPLRNAEAYQQGRVKEARAVGIRALDDHTLRLDLERPRSTLVAELADPLLSPWHRTSGKILTSRAYIDEPTSLVTNGPFRLVRANADGFRLEASEYYHGRAGVRLAGVQFLRADNIALGPLLVDAGVVDLITPTPYSGVGKKLSNRGIKLESELVLGVSSLDFNVTRGPLRDIRVRRALALAQDRAGPIKKFGGRMVPAWSWVPDMPGRDGLVLMQENAEEARRFLAAAGYPAGAGFPILTLALPLWAKSDPYPAAWSERWFHELGIRTHITYEPTTLYQQRLQAGDYDVMYGQLIATVPDAGDLLSVFLMPAQSNNMKWSDPQVVALLSEANVRTGRERLLKLEAAERAAMAAVPTVPMMFERRETMEAAEVQGWYVDPLARQSLKRLWLENTANTTPGPEPGL
jgi:oligopeptide transport system substrate-binding protein